MSFKDGMKGAGKLGKELLNCITGRPPEESGTDSTDPFKDPADTANQDPENYTEWPQWRYYPPIKILPELPLGEEVHGNIGLRLVWKMRQQLACQDEESYIFACMKTEKLSREEVLERIDGWIADKRMDEQFVYLDDSSKPIALVTGELASALNHDREKRIDAYEEAQARKEAERKAAEEARKQPAKPESGSGQSATAAFAEAIVRMSVEQKEALTTELKAQMFKDADLCRALVKMSPEDIKMTAEAIAQSAQAAPPPQAPGPAEEELPSAG